jgi:drug/metabolite transporter (DMT)-like permease
MGGTEEQASISPKSTEASGSKGGMTFEKARLCILGTAFGFSLMGLTLKMIDCNPLVLCGLEKAVCFIVLGLSRKTFHITFNKKTMTGGIFIYLSGGLFVIANKMTTAANAVILQYTNPIFVILISFFFLHRKIVKKDIIFTIVMMCGMVLFFMDDLSAGNMAGNAVAILSGVAMAMSNMYAHYSGADVREYGMINCLIAVAAGLIALLFDAPHLTLLSGGAILFYGIFCSGIPIILFAKGAPHVEPLGISMLLMIEPICGPVWVALAVHEIPGRTALIGAGIVLLALAVNSLYPAFNAKWKEKRA